MATKKSTKKATSKSASKKAPAKKATAKKAPAKKAPAKKTADHGLTVNQLATLQALAKLGAQHDGLNREQLQEAIGAKTTGYPKLIELGLVEEAGPYEGDRSKYFVATAKGRALAKKNK